MVDITLKQIDVWFREPSEGGHRPKLLSKLATLELCGWIEGEFDRLAMLAEDGRLCDPDWVRENVISKTNGFQYDNHWRPMLARLVGEVFVRRVENRMEQSHPGDLNQLKSLLGQLWKDRCSYAHAELAANIASQQTFSAPSWSLNQHRILVKLIGRYQQSMLDVLNGI